MDRMPILAVAFDCYGTLVDFGDEAFVEAYALVCAEQGVQIDGKVFFDKWMEIWRRLANEGASSDGGTIGVLTPEMAASMSNRPGPLSEAENVPPHPEHHTPSAGRNRALDGPLPAFRPYSEEWPEHFEIAFEELGVRADPLAAHNRLVSLLAGAPAFPDAKPVVAEISRRLPTALLSNADDNFLLPCLDRNGLSFKTLVSSESARAYKPHVAIFRALAERLQLSPGNILYVGDSPLADITGAKNAGMQAAWINRLKGGRRPLEGSAPAVDATSAPSRPRLQPDYEIASLSDLLDIVGGRP